MTSSNFAPYRGSQAGSIGVPLAPTAPVIDPRALGLDEPLVEPPATHPTAVQQWLLRISRWNRQRLARRHDRRSKKRQVKPPTYESWIDAFDRLTPTVIESFKLRDKDLALRPLISVLMPVFNPELPHLIAAVRSVQRQIYGDWELCIADDASTSSDITAWLKDLASRDPRVKLVVRASNGHICEASNSALELAGGEFIALLDQDDLLRPHSLLMMAEAINRRPDAALLYSDEDKIDGAGRRSGHYFKCDWNLYLLRSHNMFSHFGVYRRALVNRLGGFRKGFEGSQDYDLALRCSEQVAPGEIVHVPFVLYHWRMHEKSTAAGLEVKPYAAHAAVRALDEHLVRTGVPGYAEALPYGYRVRYALPPDGPQVTIVIPTRNRVELLQTCVESIFEKTEYPHFDLLVVDNGSDDSAAIAYLRGLAAHPRVRVVPDHGEFNFSRLNNLAISQCTSDYVCLLNNDIEVVAGDWLGEMLAIAQHRDVGAVGAKLLYPDGSMQHAGVILGLGGAASHAHKHFDGDTAGYIGRAALIQEMSAVTAACLLVKRSAYLEVGGLDERHLSVAFNDVDLCLKLKERGYRNVWTPYAVLVHHESVSRGADDDPKKHARFLKELAYVRQRWEHVIRHDPAYSPNLTVHNESFDLAFPPRVSLTDPYWLRG